jgi:hypothetical protein
VLVDLDGDGVQELVIGNEEGDVLLWRRVPGEALAFTQAEGPLARRGDLLAAPTLGDLDGDGRPEMLVGGAGGGVRLFHPATGPDR